MRHRQVRVARVEIEVKRLRCVSIKATILYRKSKTKHYILGNKTQALINEKTKSKRDASGKAEYASSYR